MFQKIINSESKTFLAFCFCFILGVGYFSLVEEIGNKTFYLYRLVFLVLFFLIIFWENKSFRFILFVGLFFILGGLRILLGLPTDNPNFIYYHNGEKVTFSGLVAREPELNIKNVRYVLEAQELISPMNKKISQRVLVSADLYPEYSYGDILKVTCNLKSPSNYPGSNFRYDRYLLTQKIFSLCDYPQISLLKKSENRGTVAKILYLKIKVAEKIDELWSEPESGFMAGILYGKRSGLDEELKENFNRVGLTHIIAVSGYNISILAIVIMFILIGLGLSRPRAFWLAVMGIIFFVIFVGGEASAVRAGIMGIIILISQKVGRMSSLLNTLVLSAVIMLIFNPWLLIWDAGFQLSFLSVLGLMFLGPIFKHFFYSSLSRLSIPDFFIEILVATLSSIIITLPLVLYQFGRLSLVAPIANVLALWIIPWLMLFGFLAVIISFIFFPLSQFVAWLAGIGLRYVIILSNWLGEKTWSAVEFTIPWWGMVLCYLVIAHLIYLQEKKQNSKLKTQISNLQRKCQKF